MLRPVVSNRLALQLLFLPSVQEGSCRAFRPRRQEEKECLQMDELEVLNQSFPPTAMFLCLLFHAAAVLGWGVPRKGADECSSGSGARAFPDQLPNSKRTPLHSRFVSLRSSGQLQCSSKQASKQATPIPVLTPGCDSGVQGSGPEVGTQLCSGVERRLSKQAASICIVWSDQPGRGSDLASHRGTLKARSPCSSGLCRQRILDR